MTEAVNACPVCGSARLSPFEDVHVQASSFHYKICLRCGVVFQSPRMDAHELQHFYEHEYRKLYQQTEEPTKKDIVTQEQRAQQTVAMITPDVARVKRHLDIGSSSGELLLEVNNYYGCESVGIEPGEGYRAYSQKRDLEVVASLDLLMKKDERFDLITMMHVLEHLRDPVQTLKELRDHLLTANGFLLIEVPNIVEHEALEIAHLYAFSASTLRECMRQSGFEVIWTRTHGGFRSPVLNLFITLLAKPTDQSDQILGVRSSPLGLATRRRLGKLKRALLTRFLPDWTWQSPPSLWPDEPE